MQITVMGKSPAWQDADGACSGYLVQEGDTRVLVDCGNGVFAKLRSVVDYVDVDAVVVSHMHADHFLDLVPFAYALIYAPRQQPVPVDRWPGTDSPARPRLLVPPGGIETLRRVVGAWGNEDLIEQAFVVEEYRPSDRYQLGSLSVRFCPVPHYLPTHAVEITSPLQRRFTYGADHCPCTAITDFAQSTDLLLLEATLPRPERTGIRGHLTPREAGEHGRRAGAQRLVLTHISDEMDEAWAQREAAETFGGDVRVARGGDVYTL